MRFVYGNYAFAEVLLFLPIDHLGDVAIEGDLNGLLLTICFITHISISFAAPAVFLTLGILSLFTASEWLLTTQLNCREREAQLQRE